MKLLYYTFFTFLAGMVLLSGCNPSSGDVSLNNEADSLSYSLGYQNGQFMAESGMDDIDPEVVKAGLQAALNKQDSKLSDAEMKQAIQKFQIKARQNAQQKKMEEGQNNQKEGEAFLEENKNKEGVQVTDSGLQYKVLEEGSGASPSEEDRVRVDYEGTLIDGTVFDSSYERGEPATFPLNRVIPGWTEGLQLMKEGAKYKFFVPGDIAYGQNPPPGSPIGTNETLIFEVELHEVNPEE
ncbi:FKBP-type peptidyl-prolyl cis-trans isomerase [Fodinibius sp. Rm-B-1B1-1]|uniref:FKBP-type peptidyl-prolyl cis-trans isomerase n=1 Tax=Fodinibius alkaliphilus TaxID=3140241 RepID=UPI00315B1365